jgi:methionyl-tRNA synthetase
LAQALCVVGQCLAPLLPSTSGKLLKQLGVDKLPRRLDEEIALAGNRVNAAHILFPKPERSSNLG